MIAVNFVEEIAKLHSNRYQPIVPKTTIPSLEIEPPWTVCASYVTKSNRRVNPLRVQLENVAEYFYKHEPENFPTYAWIEKHGNLEDLITALCQEYPHLTSELIIEQGIESCINDLLSDAYDYVERTYEW